MAALKFFEIILLAAFLLGGISYSHASEPTENKAKDVTSNSKAFAEKDVYPKYDQTEAADEKPLDQLTRVSIDYFHDESRRSDKAQF